MASGSVKQISSEKQHWEINIFSKEQSSNKSNAALENSEFENYHMLYCGAVLTLIQPSQLFLFKQGGKGPFKITLPRDMNAPKTFLSETIRSEIAILGVNTEVHAAHQGKTDAQKYAVRQYTFPQYPLNGQYATIVISVQQVREYDTKFHRRQDQWEMAGIRCLEMFVKGHGIYNKEIWIDLHKAIKSRRARISILARTWQ